jgi:DNA-binding transcriptional MerR regulator
VKISQLSRDSGISIPTLKFYLREGLLPPGTPTARNQADYTEDHVRRVRLIRAMSEVGALPLRSIKVVLAALDDPDLPVHELLGVVHRAVGPGSIPADPDAELLDAHADVERFLVDLGWKVGPLTPAPWALAQALVTLRRLGRNVAADVFEPYATAARRIAAGEVAVTAAQPSRVEAVEQVVVGTVVFGTALLALRHLAQEHHSAQRLAPALPRRSSRSK